MGKFKALESQDGERLLSYIEGNREDEEDFFGTLTGMREYACAMGALGGMKDTNATERAVVETVIRAAFDKFLAPMIKKYDPPGPDVIYVEAGRWILVLALMKLYDLVRSRNS